MAKGRSEEMATGKGVTIRPYRPEDWEQVLSIFTRAKPDELKGSVAAEDIVPLAEDEGLLKSFQQSELYVAEHKEHILGFVGYHKQLLSFLFVDPAYSPRHCYKAVSVCACPDEG